MGKHVCIKVGHSILWCSLDYFLRTLSAFNTIWQPSPVWVCERAREQVCSSLFMLIFPLRRLYICWIRSTLVLTTFKQALLHFFRTHARAFPCRLPSSGEPLLPHPQPPSTSAIGQTVVKIAIPLQGGHFCISRAWMVLGSSFMFQLRYPRLYSLAMIPEVVLLCFVFFKK